MKIYFIRHGETEYNRLGLFYGASDVPINATGRRQSRQLRQKLADMPAQYPICISSLRRTQQTAEIIFPQQRQVVQPAFNEKSFGAWEGLNAQQIEAAFPEEWSAWLAAPFAVTPPEAEPFADFQQRVLTAFAALQAADHSVVLVGHLGVLRVILQDCFPEKKFWEIELAQGNSTCIEYQNNTFCIHYWDQ